MTEPDRLVTGEEFERLVLGMDFELADGIPQVGGRAVDPDTFRLAMYLLGRGPAGADPRDLKAACAALQEPGRDRSRG